MSLDSNTSTACLRPWDAVSNGVWQGDNPIHFVLPLLIVQVSLVLAVTRSLAVLLKPLKQPRVIAEILGGVLLGPSALGHNKLYLEKIFPQQSLTILDTVATLGLLFFLFMVGLELDLNELRRTGKKSMLIAFVGISIPFVCGIGVSTILSDTIAKGVNFPALMVFVGVPLSITAFPVLVRILAERKLLTTDVGRLVLPAAAINDVCAWIFLAIGVALSGPTSSPATPVWVLLCGIAFVCFMLTVTKRCMAWIVHRACLQDSVSEVYVCITLLGVLIAGFTTDAIGIHPLFGAFVYGLVVPKEGTFAQMLTEKIEDFVTMLFLPLFFASSGLKTNLGTINSGRSVGFLILLFVTAASGKILGTFVIGCAQGVSKRKALTLGVLMNTKGLVELIVLNIGKDVKVLNDQTFAILVLMCLLTTFTTTPLVMALYKPARTHVPYKNRKLENETSQKEFRLLTCIHGTRGIPGIINLLEISRGTRKAAMKAYILHLIELSERPSSIIIARRTRKNGYPRSMSSKASGKDHIFLSFEAYGRLSKVTVRPMTAISVFQDMHEDICSTAAEKRALLIILPFHKYHRGDGELEVINPALHTVNQKVLQHAPCSVGIFVDNGSGESVQLSSSNLSYRVALFFFGGPDDREALAFGYRLAEHPGVKLTVFRFLPRTEPGDIVVNLAPMLSDPSPSNRELKSASSEAYNFPNATIDVQNERVLDDECLAAAVKHYDDVDSSSPDKVSTPMKSKFLQECLAQGGVRDFIDSGVIRRIELREESTDNAVSAVIAIAKSNDFNLFLVGRGRYPSPLIADLANRRPVECPELGPIGDTLACGVPAREMRASVVVIQQYDPTLSPESALPNNAK